MKIEQNEVPAIFLSDFAKNGMLKQRFENEFGVVKPRFFAVVGKLNGNRFQPLGMMGIHESRVLGVKVHGIHGPHLSRSLDDDERRGISAVLTMILFTLAEKGAKQDVESLKRKYAGLTEPVMGSVRRFIGTRDMPPFPLFGGLVRHLVAELNDNSGDVSVVVNGKEAGFKFENSLDRFVKEVEAYVNSSVASVPFLVKGDKSILEPEANMVASTLSNSVYAVASRVLGIEVSSEVSSAVSEEVSESVAQDLDVEATEFDSGIEQKAKVVGPLFDEEEQILEQPVAEQTHEESVRAEEIVVQEHEQVVVGDEQVVTDEQVVITDEPSETLQETMQGAAGDEERGVYSEPETTLEFVGEDVEPVVADVTGESEESVQGEIVSEPHVVPEDEEEGVILIDDSEDEETGATVEQIVEPAGGSGEMEFTDGPSVEGPAGQPESPSESGSATHGEAQGDEQVVSEREADTSSQNEQSEEEEFVIFIPDESEDSIDGFHEHDKK